VRSLRRIVAFLAAAGVLAAVLAAVGFSEVGQALTRTDWRLVVAALAVVQVQTLLSAWRWRFTAGRLGVDLQIGRAYLEYALAVLVNGTLPGGIAGDALRAARVVGTGTSTAAAVRSVVIERLAGQAAFWILAATGFALLITERGTAPGGAVTAIAAVPAMAAAAAGTTVLLARRGPRPVRAALDGLWHDVSRTIVRGGALAVQLTSSLVVAVSYVAVFALASAAIGAPLSLAGAISIIPLALLAMLVPIGFGGWGLREGAAAMLWPLAGYTPAEGVVAAALYGAIVLVGSLPGLASLAVRRPASPSITSGRAA
jgi:uncharacterized membrane protein YbhN (UPF0104 family)